MEVKVIVREQRGLEVTVEAASELEARTKVMKDYCDGKIILGLDSVIDFDIHERDKCH